MKRLICWLFGQDLMYWHMRGDDEYWTYLEYGSTAPFDAILRCHRCKWFPCGKRSES